MVIANSSKNKHKPSCKRMTLLSYSNSVSKDLCNFLNSTIFCNRLPSANVVVRWAQPGQIQEKLLESFFNRLLSMAIAVSAGVREIIGIIKPVRNVSLHQSMTSWRTFVVSPVLSTGSETHFGYIEL